MKKICDLNIDCSNCINNKVEEIDGYYGEFKIISYCKLNLIKNIKNNKVNMENSELSKNFQLVFDELSKNIGMFIKAKEISVAKLCLKFGLDSNKYEKYLTKQLMKNGYMEKKGAGLGVQIKILKEIPNNFGNKCAKEFKEVKRVVNISTNKKASKLDNFLSSPKTYNVGQLIFLLEDNRVVEGIISGIKIPENNLSTVVSTNKIQNNLLDYEVYIPKKDINKNLTIYDFSDSLDGLCSMIKYIYNRDNK